MLWDFSRLDVMFLHSGWETSDKSEKEYAKSTMMVPEAVTESVECWLPSRHEALDWISSTEYTGYSGMTVILAFRR